MKNTIKNKIKNDNSFNKNQKKLAGKIIDLFDTDERLQMSLKKIAKAVKVPDSTNRRTFKKLVEEGYVKTIKKDMQNGYTYQLFLPETFSIENTMETKCENEKTDDIEFDFNDVSFEDEIETAKKDTSSLKDFKNLTNKELNNKFYNKLVSIANTNKDLSKTSKIKSSSKSLIERMKEMEEQKNAKQVKTEKVDEPYIRSDISLPKADDLIPYTKPISKLNHNPFFQPSLKDKKIEILKNENELLRKMIIIQNKFMELKSDMQMFEIKLKELGEELKKHHSK